MRARGPALATPGTGKKATRAARAIGKLRTKAETLVRRARDVQPDVKAELLALLGDHMPSLT